jgi:amino acid transporter
MLSMIVWELLQYLLFLGNNAVLVMAALIMVSTFGCNNGLILSGARAYYAMAKDALFFKQAAELNKQGVPQNALIIQAILGFPTLSFRRLWRTLGLCGLCSITFLYFDYSRNIYFTEKKTIGRTSLQSIRLSYFTRSLYCSCFNHCTCFAL